MPPSARGSTHAYAYAGTSAGVTVGPDDCVNGSSDNCIAVNTDGSSDVRIGSASFRGPAYGVINVGVAGGIIVNVSTYVHDYGATNTRPTGSTDASANVDPECSRDVSADANSHASNARASTSVVAHGSILVGRHVGTHVSSYVGIHGTPVGTHVCIHGRIHDGYHSSVHVSTHVGIHGGIYGLGSRARPRRRQH